MVPETLNQECDVPAENDSLQGAGPEEVLLDENKEAEQHKFYMTAAVEESPDQKLLAYAEDTKGGEKFTLRVIDIASRKQLMAEPIKVRANCNFLGRSMHLCWLYLLLVVSAEYHCIHWRPS